MKHIFSALLSAFLMISGAHAQKISDEGFYGFAGAGIYTFKGDQTLTRVSTGARAGSGKFESSANGWELGLGYEYSQRFAIEGALVSALRNENDDTFASVDGTYVQTEKEKGTVNGFRLAGLVRHPISPSTRVFATAGIMNFTLDQNNTYRDTDGGTTYSETSRFDKTFTVGLFGVGLDFALDQRTSLRFSVVKTTDFDFTLTRDGYRNKTELDGTAANLAVVVRF